jgi:hypothetical protein
MRNPNKVISGGLAVVTDDNSRTDAIFLDFANAFDKVTYSNLMRKLDRIIDNKIMVKLFLNFWRNMFLLVNYC